ncbi:MAG: hypothetical protein ACYCO3_05460 [Mycobacteriales bacterium]
MTDWIARGRDHPFFWRLRRCGWSNALWIIAAVILAEAAARGPKAALITFALLAWVAAIVNGLVNMPRASLLLFALVPFVGLVGLALYPRTYLADFGTDAFLVLPLYVWLVASKGWRKGIKRLTAWTPLLLLLAIVVAHMVSSPSVLVSLVGLRGWFFYVPLLFVGQWIVQTGRCARALTVLAWAGLPALVVGISEAILLKVAGPSSLEHLYGAAASSTLFYGFRNFGYGGGSLYRVPSIFTYPLAYFLFTLVMFVAGYFLLRTRRQRLGALVCVLALMGALTSGQRIAFILVPVLVVVTLTVDGFRVRASVLFAIAAGLLVTVDTLGLALSKLPGYLSSVSGQEGGIQSIVASLSSAVRLTWVGLGTGYDTNAARNLAPGLFNQFGGWQESYIVKAWLELGVLGAVTIAWLAVAIAWDLLRSRKHSTSQSLTAAVFGFFVCIVILSVKASPLDQPPAGLFFWLLIGMASHVPRAIPFRA